MLGNASDSLSASTTLILILENLLKLFAPFVPMITEEIWTTMHPESKSIHIQDWPKSLNIEFGNISSKEFEAAKEAISSVRKGKTSLGIGLGKEIEKIKIITNAEKQSTIKEILSDVKDASRALKIEIETDESEDGIRSEI